MLLRFTKMHGLGNDFMVIDRSASTRISSPSTPSNGAIVTPASASISC